MAVRGRPIPAATIALLRRLRLVLSVRHCAREAEVAPMTVMKYAPRVDKRGDPRR